ncbi:M20/M25/M40 family metallo-hydrolase [Isachenkonia alkalipeptolytica]|uniref:M20/M25/M40 family metallo-hydrolase n=1 Tax=Isachenkonia alkalipeptolytica TaxID=2565777 RepID=A0AA43XL28_9CLOT|nr:M20/M25/M40 family metallo-hydrolase [Isachenkonia alkalipeptolytica]NBG87830.1 M20/M25/M40 family metallo-hydrolase [Isachenkonia alkalipeptolytica]
MSIEKVQARIKELEEEYLEILKGLVRQKSISTEDIGVRECADLLKGIMEKAGIDTAIYETGGQPVVYGEVKRENSESITILFYGHYDVQPPEPLDKWDSPPFEPGVRKGRIYGRGTGDNKGQLITHVLAVKTYLETLGSLPVNVKFLFEGEEEIGSPNLIPFVQKHQELLKADLVLTSDGPMHESGAPLIAFGVRGVMNFDLHLKTASTDNHSGNKGGVIPNAIWEMVEFLSTMKDEKDQVLISGFYDDVVAPTAYERELINNLPYDPDRLATVYGVDKIHHEKEDFYSRLLFKPTLTINGIRGGHIGEGTKNIIPCESTAKMEIRLVYDQEPEDLINKVKDHIQRYNPSIRLTREEEDMRPSKTSAELDISKAVIRSVEQTFSEKPVVYPGMGGSLPDYVWTKVLGVPSIMIPYANADEANHAPNENLKLDCFYNGIHTSARIIYELGKNL